MTTKRISHGVCVFRHKGPEAQVLLVKSRTTTAFGEFTLGRYKWTDDKYLNKLFNGMTVYEKLLILSRQYQKLWYHIWAVDEPKHEEHRLYSFFLTCKGRYDRFTQRDNLKRLSMLISKTNHTMEVGWGIPKGRQEKKETELDTALRELHEETGLQASDIKVLNFNEPMESSNTSGETTYICKYYTAVSTSDTAVNINFGESEINGVQWFNLSDIKKINMRTPDTVLQIQSAAKKYLDYYRPRSVQVPNQLIISKLN